MPTLANEPFHPTGLIVTLCPDIGCPHKVLARTIRSAQESLVDHYETYHLPRPQQRARPA